MAIKEITEHQKKLSVHFESANYIDCENLFSGDDYGYEEAANRKHFFEKLDKIFGKSFGNLPKSSFEVYFTSASVGIKDYEKLYHYAKKSLGNVEDAIAYFKGDDYLPFTKKIIETLDKRSHENFFKQEIQLAMVFDTNSHELRGAIAMDMQSTRTKVYAYENEFVCENTNDLGGK